MLAHGRGRAPRWQCSLGTSGSLRGYNSVKAALAAYVEVWGENWPHGSCRERYPARWISGSRKFLGAIGKKSPEVVEFYF